MPNGQRIYVGNLPPNVRERSVERFFKGYGRIREVVLKSGYGFVEFDDPRDADDACSDLDGKDFQGGRVRVEMARDPRDKRRDYHDNNYRRGGGGGGYHHHRDNYRGGRDRYSRRDDYDDHRRGGGDRGRNDHRSGGGGGNPPGPRTNYRIIVTNLSSRTSWQDLKDYFRAAGEITYTNAHTPRQGEGVVEFASRKGLDYSLDHSDNLELDGRRLKISEEKGRGGDRDRSRSRSRSRSDSRGRSRSRSPRGRSHSRDRSSRSHSRDRSRSRSRSNTPRNGGGDDNDDDDRR